MKAAGSSNYVPKEAEKDAQLQYALKMLRGEPLPPHAEGRGAEDRSGRRASPEPAAKQK